MKFLTKFSDQRERIEDNRAVARIGWRPCRPVFNIPIGRKKKAVRIIYNLRIIAVCACLSTTCLLAQTDGAQLGNMQADKILFLGNSITFCSQTGSTQWWGLSASTATKDYAHLLTQKINTATGGSLTIVPPNPHQGDANNRWYANHKLPVYNGNILNMADIFERNYDTWDNARIKNQIDGKADIVVLQIGENIPMPTFNAEVFTNSLKKIVADIKASSNPHIFMPSYILGANATVDGIKRKVCEEDPTQRVFVDLSAVGKDATNIGAYGHPNDKGMALIADMLFSAIVAHSASK